MSTEFIQPNPALELEVVNQQYWDTLDLLAALATRRATLMNQLKGPQ